jgi:hypothetical protein
MSYNAQLTDKINRFVQLICSGPGIDLNLGLMALCLSIQGCEAETREITRRKKVQDNFILIS